jgi:hypothetical protein
VPTPPQQTQSGTASTRTRTSSEASGISDDIEQSGNSIQVSFDAAYVDAHDAAPDGRGPAKITGKNALQFNWEDSLNNSGTGTIRQTGDGILVSMKTTRVVDSRCLVFYGENMRLKRVK